MRSYRFTHALTRKPAETCVDGLRAVDTGAPDFEAFQADHDAYLDALRTAGAEVTVLDPLPAYPDSVFVEDAALCLPEAAILMRPGAPSRFGEAAAIAPDLMRLHPRVVALPGTGRIEGGDILVTETEILVGLSARTDAVGVAGLREVVAEWGDVVRVLKTPPEILHFKTDSALLDEETILATPRLAATGAFTGYRVIETAEGEDAAANCIRVNDLVIAPEGFPRTAERLARDYDLRLIRNAEAAKLDGGMSCMSLRFTPA